MNTINKSLERHGKMPTKTMTRWNEEMPREEEMLPKDKYTMFDKKAKRYRKGIHSMAPFCLHPWQDASKFNQFPGSRGQILTRSSNIELPKWTRVSQRLNPPGY